MMHINQSPAIDVTSCAKCTIVTSKTPSRSRHFEQENMPSSMSAFVSFFCPPLNSPKSRLNIGPRQPHRPIAPNNSRAIKASATQATLQTQDGPARTVQFISLANNSFILESGPVRLLIDPFLEEELVFFSPSFFRAAKPPALRSIQAAGAFDAVVLTQHLPDHAHEPTLRKIDRATPIVAPGQALPLLSELGFTNVRVLTYDETVAPLREFPDVTVTAGRGSIVGPPGSPPQLALVFSFGDPPLTVYHEPHGNHDSEFLARYAGKIDAAIAPVVHTKIPLLGNYSLVNGVEEALQLCKELRPKRFVGFDNSGGEQSGFLVKFLDQNGNISEFRRNVSKVKELADMEILFTGENLKPVVIADVADEAMSVSKNT